MMKRIITKVVKPATPARAGLEATSTSKKNQRSSFEVSWTYSFPVATACSDRSRPTPSCPLILTLVRSRADTVMVLSAMPVRVETWSFVTRRTLCFARISSSTSTMYGTKSSVTPAKGSSRQSRSSDWWRIRWRISSNSRILRCPPERPAVNSPAMVPPMRIESSLASFSYIFQYGSCFGSELQRHRDYWDVMGLYGGLAEGIGETAGWAGRGVGYTTRASNSA
mmetsp:Transcript_11381/g.23813  ORF Transcript_11381/g.23813 Transcript_11381/m.23813 type:complete len:224 (-) Transcript_11381:374-1045(-)